MNPRIEKVLKGWISKVRAATINSLASITPPGDRFAEGGSKARAKGGLQKLKDKIAEKFKIVSGFPITPDAISSKEGYSPTHIYLLDRGKKKQKPRPTNLPILNSKNDVLKWWREHSYLNRNSQRFANPNSYAFVSKAAYLTSAGKEIQKHAGLFTGGWYSLFDYYGKKLTPYTQSTALSKAKQLNLSEVRTRDNDFILTAYNEANEDRRMQKYAQRIMDVDLPKTQKYYIENMQKYLEKGIQKEFDMDKNQAKSLVSKINLNI